MRTRGWGAVPVWVCALATPAAFAEPGDCYDVSDDVGDTTHKDAADYLDIALGQVCDDGSAWTFIVVMAEDLPDDPLAYWDSQRIKELSWHWGVETDTESDPAGYPLPGNNWLPYEFMVNFWADDEGYHADWIDRTPLVDAGDATETPVAYTIAGSTITVTIPKSLFEAPDGFLWRFGTTAHRSSHFGDHGYDAMDVVGFPFTPSP